MDTASSTTYWIAGLSTTGSISLGVALVAQEPGAETCCGNDSLADPRVRLSHARNLIRCLCRESEAPVNWLSYERIGRIRVQPLSPVERPAEPDKRMLRQEILAVRNRLTADDVREAAVALAGRALELPELARARTVAAYVSVGSEPGTLALLDALRARGVRVLLPALLPDNDLDWGAYTGEGSLARVQHGSKMALFEPTGQRLGPDGVALADAVLLPGLAVDARGMRLGRGGGRTTVCSPVWSAWAYIPRWWCCCTTPRSSSACPPRRTTGRWTRW